MTLFAKTFKRQWTEYMRVPRLENAQDVADYLCEVIPGQGECTLSDEGPHWDPIQWWQFCTLILCAGGARAKVLPWMAASQSPKANRQACRFIMQTMVDVLARANRALCDYHVIRMPLE